MSKKAKKQALTGKVATAETNTAPRVFDYEAKIGRAHV